MHKLSKTSGCAHRILRLCIKKADRGNKNSLKPSQDLNIKTNSLKIKTISLIVIKILSCRQKTLMHYIKKIVTKIKATRK